MHPRTHFQHRSSSKAIASQSASRLPGFLLGRAFSVRRLAGSRLPAAAAFLLSASSGRLVPLLRSQATWLRPRRRRQHGPRRRPRRNSDAASGLLKKRHMRRVSSTPSTRAYWPAHKSNCRGASSPLLNHDLHAIDATRARWRGVVVYYRSSQPAQPRSRRERTK